MKYHLNWCLTNGNYYNDNGKHFYARVNIFFSPSGSSVIFPSDSVKKPRQAQMSLLWVYEGGRCVTSLKFFFLSNRLGIVGVTETWPRALHFLALGCAMLVAPGWGAGISVCSWSKRESLAAGRPEGRLAAWVIFFQNNHRIWSN